MADLCFNILDIWGDRRADIEEFAAAVATSETPLALSRLAPSPQSLASDGDAIVEWRAEHWGVKWEPDDVTVDDAGHGLRYRFTTAYSPPHYWCEAASIVFAELRMRTAFICPDALTAGALTFHAGAVIDAQTADSASEGIRTIADWQAAAWAILASIGAGDLAAQAGIIRN